MMVFTTVIIFFTFSIAAIQVQAECPPLNSVPVMYDDETFNCARKWHGPGDAEPIKACNSCQLGNYYDHYDMQDWNEGQPYGYTGSLIVNPGCTFYGFSGREFDGTVYEYPAGLYSLVEAPYTDLANGCGDYFRSVKCRCQQKLISCVPEDEWALIFVCDAVDALKPVKCTYQRTIGTSYTAETSEHMEISEEVSLEITVGLFNLFEETLGVSATTGYDWTHTSSSTMEEEETFTVEVETTPGCASYIEQTVGHCNGNDAQTEIFKISDVGQDCPVPNMRLQRHFKNGTIIDI